MAPRKSSGAGGKTRKRGSATAARKRAKVTDSRKASQPAESSSVPVTAVGGPAAKRAGATDAKGSRRQATATTAGTDAMAALRAANPEIAALRAKTIAYIHGIGNKPHASILKCQWDHATFGFDLAERSRLAYWVSREHYPEPEQATCASGDLTSLEESPTGRGLSVRQHQAMVTIEDEVDAVAESPAEARLLRQLASHIESAAEKEAAAVTAEVARTRSAAGPRAKILPLPRAVREWITRRLVRAFLRDVRDYFYDTKRREAMRESLLERLRVGGGPFVVVAHSQGSMIAYDVLSSLEASEYQVPLFVTIGSPLGVQEVKDNIRKLVGAFAVPECVGVWLNVADRLDPVALDATLDGEYGSKGQINDRRVRNLDGPRHPHSGSGYLGHPEVYSAIRAAVETEHFQPVAPFTLARDVVRELEDQPRDERLPVLIELRDPEPGKLVPVAETRDQVVSFLEGLATSGGSAVDDLEIEQLDRYVAARLTREEAEHLAQNRSLGQLPLSRVWRNSVKRALLHKSAATVQATTAHDGYRALGQDIGWAVLDTGIAQHEHFAAHQNIVAEFDCTRRLAKGKSLEAGTAPDRNGHGTHVAGIIAGTLMVLNARGEEVRVSGMAPQARLWIYKVLNDSGYGNDAWIIRALDHIASVNEDAGSLRIHGVNLSLGGPFDQSVFGCGHSPLCNELRRLWRQGVLVVLAAGNEGFVRLESEDGPVDANMDLSIGDPANLQEAIAVGSVHKENPHTYGVSYFSSRGPTADGRQKPDLVAPGERILSCRHVAVTGASTLEQLYVAQSGTSMAAPHVSGILAAFLSARQQFIGYPDWVKEMLMDNCTDLKRDRPMQGAGLPNLTRMLLNS